MKNTIILMLICLFSLQAKSQFTQERIISEMKMNMGNYKFKHIERVSDSDTSEIVYFIFQNSNYSIITDLKIISFENNEDIDLFIKVLRQVEEKYCVDYIDYNWSTREYKIRLQNSKETMSNRASLYFDNGVALLNKTQISKMIAYLEQNKLSR